MAAQAPRRALRAALAAAALAAGAAPACAGPGTSPFAFLTDDFNARSLALGGAYTALAQDAAALHYNPAGLAFVERSEASLMHSSLAEGVGQERLGYASPHNWGLSVNYLGSGPVQRTTISHPNGVGADAQAYTVAFGGGAALRFANASLGAGAKLIRGSVDAAGAFGAAFDLGMLYSLPGVQGVTLGAAAQNIGPNVRYEGVSEPLPTVLRLGGAYSFLLAGSRCAATFDLRHGRDGGGARPAGGFEAYVARVMPVRVGVSARADGGADLTAGVGFQLQSASFDYGTLPFSPLGVQHRISASVRWGESRGELQHERALNPLPKAD